jgi:hypothetical protein
MKAKYTSIFLSLLFISFGLSAQEEVSEAKAERSPYVPAKGDIGATILVGGLINNIQLESPKAKLGQNILFVRYYLEDDIALRLGLGVNLNSYKQEKADSAGLTLISTDSLFNNYIINISGGIEKHLKSTNRLDPYIFGQLNLTFIGKEKTEINRKVASSAGESKVERVIKKDGGFGIGVAVGGGFNYFIAKRFSLGTELGLIFQYSAIGGTTSDNTISTPINGSSTNNFNSSESLVKKFDIAIDTNALINLSYFF